MKNSEDNQIIKKVIEKLKMINDLELPINIYDLGIIYKTDLQYIDNKMKVIIEMTTINSRCSSTKSFTDKIVSDILSIDDVDECSVKFVFSPKWEVTMISPEGLEQLRAANS